MHLLLYIIAISMPEEKTFTSSSTVSPITIIPRPDEARLRDLTLQDENQTSQTNASMVTYSPAINPILSQNRGRRLSQLSVDFRIDSKQTSDLRGLDPHGHEIESSPPTDDGDHQKRLRLSRGGVDWSKQREKAPRGIVMEEDGSSDDFITDDESSKPASSVDVPLGTKVDRPSKPAALTTSALTTPFKAKAKAKAKAKLSDTRRHSATCSSPSSIASSIFSSGKSISTLPTTNPSHRSTRTWSFPEQLSPGKGSISTRSEDMQTTLSEFAAAQGWQCDGHPGW
jgi:hypothetical protein